MTTLGTAHRWRPPRGPRRRLIPSAVAAFNPNSITGLTVWLAFDDTSTITDAGAGAVSQVTGKSGIGPTVTQGTAGNRPTTGTETMNSLNVIRFTADDWLDSSAAAFGPLSTSTIFVVFKAAAFTTTNMLVDSVTASFRNVLFSASGNSWAMFAGAQIQSVTGHNTGPHQLCGVFNNLSGALFLDGTSIVTGTVGTQTFKDIRIGASQNAPTTDDWNGQIAEVLVYSGVLGTTDRQAVEGYLRTKWATP